MPDMDPRAEALLLALLDHPHQAAEIAAAYERDPEALFADDPAPAPDEPPTA